MLLGKTKQGKGPGEVGLGQGVSILYGRVRECLSNEVTFAQRTERNKTKSLMDMWGKITETAINVPTGNVLGLKAAGLSVLRMKEGGIKQRGSFGNTTGIH